MNILYLITADLNIGGAQKDIVAYAKEFTKRGHKIIVAARSGELEEDLSKIGAAYYNVDFHFRSLSSLNNSVNTLREIITNESVDIIAPQSIRTSIASYLANKTSQRPIITTIHNVGSRFYSLISGLLLNTTSNLVIFESEYERERLLKFGLNPDKSIVINSGINLEKFTPREKDENLLRRLNINSDDIIIGTVARLSPEKDQRCLVAAMKEVIKIKPNIKLFFVGDGPCKDMLTKQVLDLGLDKNIQFLGRQKDIPNYLSIMDLFVLSSRRESFPLSAREAMAMGKPVILTNVGGCPELISERITGMIVPPADSKSIACAILKILSDKNKISNMGKAARKKAEYLFDQSRWINTHEEIMLNYSKAIPKEIPKKTPRKLLSSISHLFSGLKHNNGIRILMYHSINDTHPYDRLSVKVNEFRKQMEHLHKKGYKVITLEEAYSNLQEEDALSQNKEKPKIVLTFDDGLYDNYKNAFPILKEYSFPSTIFLTTGSINKKEGFLNWADIEEMSKNNIMFGAHTLTHPKLTNISLNEAEKEIFGYCVNYRYYFIKSL